MVYLIFLSIHGLQLQFYLQNDHPLIEQNTVILPIDESIILFTCIAILLTSI